MELGVMIPHTGRGAGPGHVRDFCVLAEASGLDGLWAVDHLVLPHHTDSLYPLGRTPVPVADGAISDLLAPNYEMMVTLAWVAGITSKITLGTSVAVLPIRNALTNARQLASLDVLSGGRLTYGVGVGWLQEEAEALGMPWDQRGRRSEEHIALLRTVWCAPGPLVEFHGEFNNFPPIDPEPRPSQRPIPILIGGHSDRALDRAARLGDGWIAGPMSAERVRSKIERLRELTAQHGRDPEAQRVVAHLRPRSDVPLADAIAAYAMAGVDHLQVDLARRPGSEALDGLSYLAEVIAPDVRAL